jgi:hypothetical protein
MLGGRYLWWIMACIAGFVAMCIYFEYATWAVFRTLGCRSLTSSCGMAAATISQIAQILALCIVPLLLLGATVVRLRFLGLSRAWAVAAFFWLIAVIPVAARIDELWQRRVDWVSLIAAPPSAIFLALLCVAVSLPLRRMRITETRHFTRSQRFAGMVFAGAAFLMLLADPAILSALTYGRDVPVVGIVIEPFFFISAIMEVAGLSTMLRAYTSIGLVFGVLLASALFMMLVETIRRSPRRVRKERVIARPTVRQRGT